MYIVRFYSHHAHLNGLTFQIRSTSCHSDLNKIFAAHALGAGFSVVKVTEHTHDPEAERKRVRCAMWIQRSPLRAVPHTIEVSVCLLCLCLLPYPHIQIPSHLLDFFFVEFYLNPKDRMTPVKNFLSQVDREETHACMQ